MSSNRVRLEIERCTPFAGGMSFGGVGPYERLLGKAHYAIDPDEEGLPYVCDLDLAPRNPEGLVEFSGTLDIVKPVEPSAGAEGGENVQPYPAVEPSTATLTLREHEADPRTPVAHSDWELSTLELHVKGGFKPGWIYELIYETEGSRVMGLGFLGIRDLLSMLRNATHDSDGTPNPVAGHVDKVYGTGQ